jgi:hypothetical protein
MLENLIGELTTAIAGEFAGRKAGHCLRVDNLKPESAYRLCDSLGQMRATFATYVLSVDPRKPVEIRADQAIEMRNQKGTGLCLLVPAGLGDLTASSLGNSFATFDLRRFLQFIVERLERGFSAEIQASVRRIRLQLKGRASVSHEDLIGFYLSIKSAPDSSAIGRELWRVGLIPDVASDFLQRLPRNRRCVDAIARPARPQSSAAERLAGLGLPDGAFKTRLAGYLSGKLLHRTEDWQKPIAEDPLWTDLDFHLWPFPDQPVCPLQSITVESFLDSKGKVLPRCKLKQPNGPGTSLQARMGAGQKVTVHWTTDPPAPTGVKGWRVELIPARREWGEEPVGHLALTIAKDSAKLRRSANVSLDLEEETSARAVEIRISAETIDGCQAQTETGEIIYGYSNEFWLVREIDEGVTDKPRKKTEISLPFARLRSTLEVKEPHLILAEEQPEWDESDDPWYFSALLEQKVLARVAVSAVCARIEDQMRDNPRAAWPIAQVESDRSLAFGDVTWDAIPMDQLEQKAWTDFMRQRDLLMRELSKRSPQHRVASIAWDEAIADRALKYARSYRDLLDSVSGEGLSWALKLDVLQLTICYPGARQQTAAVILPLHPLRFLWYSAYADLLEHWRKELAKTASKRERGRRLELAAIERLAPLNLPMYVMGPDDHIHVFAQNLGFHLGVALPAEAKEPARALSEIGDVLGLPAEYAAALGFPGEKLGNELTEYRRLHPYSDTLRVSISNPGDGYQVAMALAHLYENPTDGTQPADPPKLDVVAHASEPLPLNLPGLDRLRDQLYVSDIHRKASHLAPVAQLAIRSMEQVPYPPGGDVNLALLIDEAKPELRPSAPISDQDSASVYGLLTRIASDFRSDEDAAEWVHQVALPVGVSREKHPVQHAYTPELVDAHRAALTCVCRWLGEDERSGSQPSLAVRLGYEDRNRLDLVHHGSDWVILLDRFLGVDLFDNPVDPYLESTARKYLLDYAPEFIEGLGHRLVVTTAWREEVEDILALAMKELGFTAVEESVSEVLQALKSVSGRLALRMIHDNTRAREAASLGVVVAWLKATGELTNSALIPVDAHPELFSVAQAVGRQTPEAQQGTLSRCDLVQIRARANRLDATFMEVKSRTSRSGLTELTERMCDQMEATEKRFRDLFFSPGVRVDHVLQRSKLAAVLRFYTRRAGRYGFFESPEATQEALRLISKLEGGIPHLKASYRGYIVDLAGKPQKPFANRGAQFRVLTARDFGTATILRSDVSVPESEPKNGKPEPSVEAKVERSVSNQPALDSTRLSQVSTPPPAVTGDLPTEVVVPVGVSLDGEVVAWKGAVTGSPHLFILGIPGQGKSWTVTRLLCGMAQHGLPAIVIDFHGQFGTAASPYYRAVGPSVWDATQGLPFSPFEAVQQLGGGTSYWKTNCFSVAEILQYVFGLGDIQRGLIYDAMRDCYEEAGFESAEIPDLPKLADLERKIRYFEDKRGIRNVLVRCKPIFEFQLFKEDADAGSGDLLAASRRGLVIDLHQHSLEQLQMAAGAFVLRKLYKDMFRWGETDHLRLAIVLDEAHRLSRDITLPKLMKEGRKFGVVVISASQGVTDFHPDVLGNAGTKIIFRTNFPASRKVAGFLKPRRDENLADKMEQLPVGTALIQTPEMPHAVQARMRPPADTDEGTSK